MNIQLQPVLLTRLHYLFKQLEQARTLNSI